MEKSSRSLRVAFIHPDLGIGGAERLVVDAALGLQKLGHYVDIYTSYHDPYHCFEETKDGTLRVYHVVPPFPRSFKGKFHILFAHLRQLHLMTDLLSPGAPTYDVYFVDQLSTCIPLLRLLGHTRVVFYCHFPDKLLANGAFVEGNLVKKKTSFLKWVYRLPMDWLEETTTRQADVILANSKFTARVSKSYFPSIKQTLRVVYPGINISAYMSPINLTDEDIMEITSQRRTLLSLNRFEGKKNILLALKAFALVRNRVSDTTRLRLVLAGGYDPRLEDNVNTLRQLIQYVNTASLTFYVTTPGNLPETFNVGPQHVKSDPDVLFVLNFTTAQRTALLRDPNTLALLYTPANEHFGIVPVEAMACGVPVLACDSGGPTESILSSPSYSKAERTGWLKQPDPEVWADALTEIVSLSPNERSAMSVRAKERATALFGMEAMAKGLEEALFEAVEMGRVDSWALTVVVMLVGFMIAYLVGPFILPAAS
ncbi:mannosyltransferase [Agrocybe pediades]|nr:mannosyltransferase [Agrocybe pediades]